MELEKDLEELQQLRGKAIRPMVIELLESKIDEINRALNATKDNNMKCGGTQSTTSDTTIPLPCVKITDYAWDQSDNFIKLYLTIPGVDEVLQQQISTNFTENGVEVRASNVRSTDYSLLIKGLLHDIVPSDCQIKQKMGMLSVMLKKKKSALNWTYLTKAEMQSKEKSKPKFNEKDDPQESLMSMMKQMYEEGDDEMKRTIRKAWHESQSRKSTFPGADDE